MLNSHYEAPRALFPLLASANPKGFKHKAMFIPQCSVTVHDTETPGLAEVVLSAENSSVCTKSGAGCAQGMAETAAKITEISL